MTPAAWRSAGEWCAFQRHRVFLRRAGVGPPLLLIHGFPTSSWDWHALWPTLTRTHHVIAPDLLGFGSSSKPHPHAYRLSEQADLIEAVLKQCGVDEIEVIAHDYGDSVGQELLTRSHRGHLHVRLRSMTFLNGGLFPECHRALPVQRLLASKLGPLLQPLLGRAGLARSMRRIFGPHSQPDDAMIDAFWSEVAREHGRRVLPALLGYLGERRALRERWVTAMQATTVPIAFINGTADPISGGHMADRWSELLPGRAVFRLDGIGHYPQLEAPIRVLEAWNAFMRACGDQASIQGTPSMTPKQVVQAFVDRFNAGDIDGLAALYAEDAINHQVVTEPLHGRAAIRHMFEIEFGRAEMVCIVENLFTDGDWAILEWRDPKGLRGCGFFQVRDGRIVFQRGYFDQLSFFRQQGIAVPDSYLGS